MADAKKLISAIDNDNRVKTLPIKVVELSDGTYAYAVILHGIDDNSGDAVPLKCDSSGALKVSS